MQVKANVSRIESKDSCKINLSIEGLTLDQLKQLHEALKASMLASSVIPALQLDAALLLNLTNQVGLVTQDVAPLYNLLAKK